MHDKACVNGHPQRGPLDYFADGQCRQCDRDNQARYRTRRSAAMELARALEGHGIAVMGSDVDPQKLAAALAGSYTATTATG